MWQGRTTGRKQPGVEETREVRQAGPVGTGCTEILAAIPAGHWTTPQALGEAIGTTAAWVGRHLYNRWETPNLHRMLEPTGSPWRWFQWPDPHDSRDVIDVLKSEGVIVGPTGRAVQSLFIGPDALQQFLPFEDAATSLETNADGAPGHLPVPTAPSIP